MTEVTVTRQNADDWNQTITFTGNISLVTAMRMVIRRYRRATRYGGPIQLIEYRINDEVMHPSRSDEFLPPDARIRLRIAEPSAHRFAPEGADPDDFWTID